MGFTRVASWSSAKRFSIPRMPSATTSAASVPKVMPVPEKPVPTQTCSLPEERPMKASPSAGSHTCPDQRCATSAAGQRSRTQRSSASWCVEACSS
jgi:hypothetical protein